MGKSKHRHRLSSWFKSWFHPSSGIANQDSKQTDTSNEIENETNLDRKSQDAHSNRSALGQEQSHHDAPSPPGESSVTQDDLTGMVTSIKEKEEKIRADSQYAGFFQLLSNSNDLGKQISHMESYLDSLLGIAEAQLAASQAQKDLAAQQLELMLREHESDCISALKQTDYEGHKFSVPKKVDGTCEWFKTHPRFCEWIQGGSNFLLVSADPGCGKSVLAKHLIDSVLPETGTQVCYFFFKDGNPDTTSLSKALCGLLHQLLSTNRGLLRHAITDYANNKKKLMESPLMLWNILLAASADEEAGNVICVLDALDECEENGLRTLQGLMNEHFTKTGKEFHLRFFFTSRPYNEITSGFQIQGSVRIPGEAEDSSGKIAKEITLVINERIRRMKLEPKLARHLEKRLTAIENRTYLWVYLVFDELKRKRFKRTMDGIDEAFRELPKSVDNAYEKILYKVEESEEPKLRRALCMILAAYSPLTISEMNLAMEVTPDAKTVDLEADDSFQERLQSWSDPFISIIGNKVYLLHQTAREFLLKKVEAQEGQSSSTWRQSITEAQAHYELATVSCYYVANLVIGNRSFSSGTFSVPTTKEADRAPPFLSYATKTIGRHVEKFKDHGGDLLELQGPLENLSERIFQILPPRFAEKYPRHWILSANDLYRLENKRGAFWALVNVLFAGIGSLLELTLTHVFYELK